MMEELKMNIRKIIKGIAGLGIMGGIAYLAYKVGESNGAANERIHAMADIEEDEDFNFYDEPDDGCVAPMEFDVSYDEKHENKFDKGVKK